MYIHKHIDTKMRKKYSDVVVISVTGHVVTAGHTYLPLPIPCTLGPQQVPWLLWALNLYS